MVVLFVSETQQAKQSKTKSAETRKKEESLFFSGCFCGLMFEAFLVLSGVFGVLQWERERERTEQVAREKDGREEGW